MLTIGARISPEVVFVAPMPGMYQFAGIGSGARFSVGDEEITPHQTGANRLEFTVQLDAGAELKHQGPACSLSGVRLGDEL